MAQDKFMAQIGITADPSSKAALKKEIADYFGKNPISVKFKVDESGLKRQFEATFKSVLNSAEKNAAKGAGKNIASSFERQIAGVQRQIANMLRSPGLALSGGQRSTLTGYFNEIASAATRGTQVAEQRLSEMQSYITRLHDAARGTAPALREMLRGLNTGGKSATGLRDIIKEIDTLDQLLVRAQNTNLSPNILKGLGINDISALRQQAQQLRDVLLDINAKPFGEDISADVEKIRPHLQSLIGTAQELNRALGENMTVDTSKVAQQFSQLEQWLKRNTKAYRAYKQEFDAIRQEYESSILTGMTEGRNKELVSRARTLMAQAGQEGNLGLSAIDKLKKGWEKFGGWSIVTRSMMAIVHTAQSLYRNVEQLDGQLAQLRIITGETASSMDRFADSAANAARRVGASLTDITASATEWARLGYNLNEALSLAEKSKMFSNVAGLDVDSATSYLISTMKAFDVPTDEVNRIIDAMTQVGNRFPISAAGIGEAMASSAAALKTAGNDMYESIGLITAGNVVNQNPNTVATALKTSTLRIRGAKTELEEMGEETDNLAESTSKLRSEIKALTGVDIMANESAFKSTYQMYKELADVWQSGQMSDTSQASLLEILGGKRNANVIASILENFDTAEGAYEAALNSAGAAEEANAIYLDTISGKVAQLGATWQELSKNLLDDEGIKLLVDGATRFLKTINNIIDKVGTLRTLIPTVAGVMSLVGNVG